jgi:hypothetical protein
MRTRDAGKRPRFRRSWRSPPVAGKRRRCPSSIRSSRAYFLSLNLTGTFTSGARGVVNPDEKQPYTNEMFVQFERQLIPDLAARLTVLHTRVRNVVRLANLLRPYEAYNIPIVSRDPGEDGIVNNADDPGTFITWFDYPASLGGIANQKVTYVNDPAANEEYTGFEMAVTKRLSNNWQFSVAHTATKKNIPLTPNEDTFNTQDPNAEIFAANNTWEWLSRVSGSYLFPYGILTSVRYEARNGLKWARTAILDGGRQIPNITVRVEELGARQLKNIHLLNLRAEKRFGMGSGRELQVRTNLYNVTNTIVATNVNTQSGATFGTLTGQVLPRIVNFEVEFRF